jgi:hypothetical protein
MLLWPAGLRAQATADVLVLRDIGSFRVDQADTVLLGEPPIGGPRSYEGAGCVAATGHLPDHRDTTYEVLYHGPANGFSPVVSVTKHAGGEGDRWLLHEVERSLRVPDDDGDNVGHLYSDAGLMSIEGSTLFRVLGVYLWVSGSRVIEIEGDYLQTGPLDVVKAYVERFPSSLPQDLALDRTHDLQWIREEMERRLWLSEKWLHAVLGAKVQPRQGVSEAVRNMTTFLQYRERFYGVKKKEEFQALEACLDLLDDNGLLVKLREYQKWFDVNRERKLRL